MQITPPGRLQGLFLSGDEWITGQRAKAHLIREVLDVTMAHCDVIMQTGPSEFDSIGLPELALPIGFRAVGANPTVPVGTIVGGRLYEEDVLLELAAAYQAVTSWHTERPADPPAAAAADAANAARTMSPAEKPKARPTVLVLSPEEALAQSN
jgi:aspartyl-tRNA(Asn)/glutamyl-tRNA(Gln) amidotransferase subunit A